MNTERLAQIIKLRFDADGNKNGDATKTKPEFDFKSYPWDQCIADNTDKYGEKGAAKVCGAIKNMSEEMEKVPTDHLNEEKEAFIIPKPMQNENKDQFIARCMKAIGGEDKPQEQLLAICYAQIESK